jgi:serine/threonine-protein phosphatase 2A regulatory subunit B''
MESASQAPVNFQDIMCQMQDMLCPAEAGRFTLRDLRRARQLAGTMFNILFNLSKFVAFETRDPFIVRQEKQEDPEATDWDRFARQEYIRLALEEDTVDEGGMGEDAGWDGGEGGGLLEMSSLPDGVEPMDTSGPSPLVTPSFLS